MSQPNCKIGATRPAASQPIAAAAVAASADSSGPPRAPTHTQGTSSTTPAATRPRPPCSRAPTSPRSCRCGATSGMLCPVCGGHNCKIGACWPRRRRAPQRQHHEVKLVAVGGARRANPSSADVAPAHAQTRSVARTPGASGSRARSAGGAVTSAAATVVIEHVRGVGAGRALEEGGDRVDQVEDDLGGDRDGDQSSRRPRRRGRTARPACGARAPRWSVSSHRDDLARVEDAGRVQRGLDRAVHAQADRAEFPLQPVALQQPDAVLAGDRAAECRGRAP